MKHYHDKWYRKLWCFVMTCFLWLFRIIIGCLIIFAICCVAAHFLLNLESSMQDKFKWAPNFILGFFGTNADSLSSEKYTNIVNDIVLFIGISLAVSSVLLLSHKISSVRGKFQKEWGFESSTIKKPGVDDIKWMMRYYKKADRITIFAGSFDWILDDSDFTSLLKKKASERKLQLISYRSREQVEKAFCDHPNGEGDVFSRLSDCFAKFDSRCKDIQFTRLNLLRTGWQFLFKSKSDDGRKGFNTCISRTEKNRELLQILADLTDPENLKEN